ncbi:hypothetical protein NBM50_12940 [Xylophilus ampelinus]|nr:hypothetical protein [Xylophilus ampelinus]
MLVVVAVVAIAKVRSIDAALRANSEEHTSIQRYAINFRGSAHDRAIATRDVVLAANAADRQAEVETIQRLARFYAESAGPLEKSIGPSATLQSCVGSTARSRPSNPGRWRPRRRSSIRLPKAISPRPGMRFGRRPSRSTCNGWRRSTS